MTGTPTPHDPVPSEAWPSLAPVTGDPPTMPQTWHCTALLHPFSPPPSGGPKPEVPFFQLCLATVDFVAGEFLSAQVEGCSYGTWWYLVTAEGTTVSLDRGDTWEAVDLGWTLPTDWFGAHRQDAACAGSSPLSWMGGPTVDWWKVPVPIDDSPPGATWMWFDSETAAPVRMMFGYGPPTPTMGDPGRLALFQMFSFSYVPEFAADGPVSMPDEWSDPTFAGFAAGNPEGYESFVWDDNFGFTALMTPVNEQYDPLPTRILYVWKPDEQYAVASDRSQSSVMRYPATNPAGLTQQEALLTGHPPAGIDPPPHADTGYLVSWDADGERCEQFGFPQEPPDWISIPAVEARIEATITDHPVVCPGTTVTVFSALFPPAPPNYPEATYLWTWYAPQTPDGRLSRPVTFMQSQSGVGVGTSLALADYFYWRLFEEPIDPGNFTVPTCCPGTEAGPG